MATSSITKKFVIKDNKACDNLLAAMDSSFPRKVVKTNRYEEGKEKLARYFGR